MTDAAPATVAVMDANGIIGLAKAGALSYVPRIFDRIVVPAEVVDEVLDPVSQAALHLALDSWMVVAEPSADAFTLASSLGTRADRAVLALGIDQSLCVIVSGDVAITKQAERHGIECVDPPRLIQALAEAGAIAAARPFLDRMREMGFGIPQSQYERILSALGELT